MTGPGTLTAEQTALTPPVSPAPPASALRRARLFGTGFGIAVSGGNLEAVIVRSRPSASVIAASTVITGFASRPAAEWGSELLRFLAGAGEPQLAATVVLPREEVIVRTVRLAGVAEKDIASAIELQLDTIHPWEDEPVEWAWWRVTAADVVVGVVRQSVLNHYETLFSEAGIPMAAATFSSAVIYAALRLRQGSPASIFCFLSSAPGRIEVYGESEARPCYSAGFTLAPERALAIARAELRIPPDQPAFELSQALPETSGASPLAAAAALAASAPLLVRYANLLPAERRASHDRARYLLPIVLGGLLVLALLGVFVAFPLIDEHRYTAALTAEFNRLQQPALRVQSIDKQLASHRARIAALDDFRKRPQADLDLMNELVRILPAQVWTDTVEIYPDHVVLAGQADQAAPLLKLLDSSPFFEKSEFVTSVSRNGSVDQFRIKTMRRGRAGRTTP
ncbi:MAG TPA: PilN domain-containing protein [Bryobacteraceae bacterium]|nr:PilN domain-containing protein [Bryobacteraceae bacterium]